MAFVGTFRDNVDIDGDGGSDLYVIEDSRVYWWNGGASGPVQNVTFNYEFGRNFVEIGDLPALPLFGATPAVWNTCLVFFQAALLAGLWLTTGCGDDDSGDGLQSQLTLSATSGQTYIIVLDTYGGFTTTGDFVLNITAL